MFMNVQSVNHFLFLSAKKILKDKLIFFSSIPKKNDNFCLMLDKSIIKIQREVKDLLIPFWVCSTNLGADPLVRVGGHKCFKFLFKICNF